MTEREVIDSDELYEEFYSSEAFCPEDFQRQLTEIGMTPESVDRLLSKGMVVTAILDKSTVYIEFIPGTVAAKFQAANRADPTLTEDQKQDNWRRFYKDSRLEENPDRFQAQWPELF